MMNATHLKASNSTLPVCGSVKCQFSVGNRVAIIFFFFLIFVASFIGNSILSFAIIRHKGMRRSSTNFSVLSLSLANILITAFCIPVFVIDAFIVDKWTFGAIGCKLVAFLQNLAINASIFTLVIISVEKFLVVCFPFRVRSQKTKVRYLVLGGWVVGIIQSSVYLSYKKLKMFNGIPYCIDVWPSFKTRQIFLVVEAVALRIIPLVLMIALHVVTIVKIKARLKYRAQENSAAKSAAVNVVGSQALKKRQRAVVMLVFIVTAAAVTLFPHYCFRCWRLLANSEKLPDVYTFNIFITVFTWLLFFNSTCHPIIFGLMSSKYRKAAKRTLSITWKSPLGSSMGKKKRQQLILMAEQGGNFNPSAST